MKKRQSSRRKNTAYYGRKENWIWKTQEKTSKKFWFKEENYIAKTLAELTKQFADKPVSEQKYTIDGKEYIVISHYVGNKDIDTVLGVLAERRAYEDLRKSVG